MKIALKFNTTTKIYSGEMDYSHIVAFANKEFSLSTNNYSLTFMDEDGDEISVCSNSDLTILQDLNKAKNIVKVYVKFDQYKQAQQIIDLSDGLLKNQDQPEILKEEPKEEAVKMQINEPNLSEQREKPHSGHKWSHWGWGKRGHEHRHHTHHHHQDNKNFQESEEKKGCRKFMKLQHFMKQEIAKQVDERVKTLVPCIKNQISGGNPIKLFSSLSPLVHENTECISCYATPITGIRYSCPKCPNFNLCQHCQMTVQHQHYLLKIKTILPEQSKEKQCLFPFGLFGRQRRHDNNCHSSSSSKSFQKCKDPEFWADKKMRKMAKAFGGQPKDYQSFVRANNQLFIGQTISKFAKDNNKDIPNCWQFKMENKKCQKLAKMFGGQPQKYQKFVKNNLNKKPKELVDIYAKQNNISDLQLKQKRIVFKCQKLGFIFNKQPQIYRSFVESNIQLKAHQLKRKLIEQNIEKRPERDQSHKKQFSRKSNERFIWNINPCQVEKKKEKSAEMNQMKGTLSCKKGQKECSTELRAAHQEKVSKKEVDPKDMTQKGNILRQLVEYFGTQHVNEYYKIVEEHYKEGVQKVIQIYLDSQTK